VQKQPLKAFARKQRLRLQRSGYGKLSGARTASVLLANVSWNVVGVSYEIMISATLLTRWLNLGC